MHYFLMTTFITARQRSCGKVMFSVVCVCVCVFREGRGIRPLTQPPLKHPSPPSPYRALPLSDTFKLVQLGPPPRHTQTCSLCKENCQLEGGWHSTERPSCIVHGILSSMTCYSVKIRSRTKTAFLLLSLHIRNTFRHLNLFYTYRQSHRFFS